MATNGNTRQLPENCGELPGASDDEQVQDGAKACIPHHLAAVNDGLLSFVLLQGLLLRNCSPRAPPILTTMSSCIPDTSTSLRTR